MKALRFGAVGAALMITALGPTASISAQQPGAPATASGPAYALEVLPSLGGTSSAGNGINDRGWITGQSNLAGDKIVRAALWRDGKVKDLGTLGGPDSAVLWPVKNNRGIVTGVAQTANRHTYGEQWSCAAFFPKATATGHRCVGFEWRHGVMHALPTLGGPNGFATGSNNAGQVVGWAENTVRDPTCVAPQIFQFRGVVWGPGRHQVRQLRPLPGDTVSAATAINDEGQVVGISGYCDNAIGGFSAIHAVLWQGGRPISLGTLGGVAWNTPMAINDAGVVVGFSNTSASYGGTPHFHAFVWTRRGGIHDLGTLRGDATSEALGINDQGVIVGESCPAAGNCHAVTWRDGKISRLQSRLSSASGYQLLSADDINDAGVITGQALDPSTKNTVAYAATPQR